jgi:hypothetical protein
VLFLGQVSAWSMVDDLLMLSLCHVWKCGLLAVVVGGAGVRSCVFTNFLRCVSAFSIALPPTEYPMRCCGVSAALKSPCNAIVADMALDEVMNEFNSYVMCSFADVRSPAVGMETFAVHSAPSEFGAIILNSSSLPATPLSLMPMHLVDGTKLRWISVMMEWCDL